MIDTKNFQNHEWNLPDWLCKWGGGEAPWGNKASSTSLSVKLWWWFRGVLPPPWAILCTWANCKYQKNSTIKKYSWEKVNWSIYIVSFLGLLLRQSWHAENFGCLQEGTQRSLVNIHFAMIDEFDESMKIGKSDVLQHDDRVFAWCALLKIRKKMYI